MGVFGRPCEVDSSLPRICRQKCAFSGNRFAGVRSKIAVACCTMSMNEMLGLVTGSEELLDAMAFRRLVQRLGIVGISPKEFGAMFEALDKRSSGTIDPREAVRALYSASDDERRLREKEKAQRGSKKKKSAKAAKDEILLEISEKKKNKALAKLKLAASRWQPGQALCGLSVGGPLCVDDLKQAFRVLFNVSLDTYEAAALLEYVCSENDDIDDDSHTVSTCMSSSTLKSHNGTLFAQRFVRLAQDMRQDFQSRIQSRGRRRRQEKQKHDSITRNSRRLLLLPGTEENDAGLSFTTIHFTHDDLTVALDKFTRAARSQLDGNLAPDLHLLKNGAQLNPHGLRHMLHACFRIMLSLTETAALASLLPQSQETVDAGDLLASFHKLVRTERAKERIRAERITERRKRRNKKSESRQLDLLKKQAQRAIIFPSEESKSKKEEGQELSHDVAKFLQSVDRAWNLAEPRKKLRLRKRSKPHLRNITEEEEGHSTCMHTQETEDQYDEDFDNEQGPACLSS